MPLHRTYSTHFEPAAGGIPNIPPHRVASEDTRSATCLLRQDSHLLQPGARNRSHSPDEDWVKVEHGKPAPRAQSTIRQTASRQSPLARFQLSQLTGRGQNLTVLSASVAPCNHETWMRSGFAGWGRSMASRRSISNWGTGFFLACARAAGPAGPDGLVR
jgi:hypothetical protein